MNSDPIIDKDFLRSDEDPNMRRIQQRETNGEEENDSGSFSAVDMYRSERNEYLYSTLLSGILLTPILITIHELLVIRKQVNEYEVAYAVAVVQTVTMFFYHWYRGLFFFNVPKEGRVLLIVRSLLYALSFTLFISSMSFLNPVVALIC